jgi:3-dehydroquinate dehydratase
VVKLLVQVRSLSSRREQVVLVRVLSVLLFSAVAVLHTQFVHVHISNAHLRR